DTALVELDEVAVVGNALVTQHQSVGAQAVGEGCAPGVVVDLAITILGVAAGPITRFLAVLAVGRGAEVAQIGLQRALAQRQVVAQTGEVLLVVVLEVRVVVLRGQIAVDLPVTTGETELVARLGATGNRQPGAVARGTANGVLDLTSGQGQVVDFVGGDHAAFEHLRQHTTVVGDQDRQFRHQGTDASFGLGETNLAGQAALAELINSAAIAFQREQLARSTVTASLGVATTTIQTHAQEADGVNAETHGAFGEARLVVENEALPPLAGLAIVVGSVDGVVVEVEVAQGQAGLAVTDEIGRGQLAQGAGGDGQGQGSFFHDARCSRCSV